MYKPTKSDISFMLNVLNDEENRYLAARNEWAKDLKKWDDNDPIMLSFKNELERISKLKKWLSILLKETEVETEKCQSPTYGSS